MYIRFNFVRREIYYDMDGSLTNLVFDGNTRPNATLIPYFVHNDFAPTCVNATNQTQWNISLLCDSTVVVRSIAFGNAIPEVGFQAANINVYRLTNSTQNISSVSSNYSTTWMVKAMIDKPLAWATPFIMGQIYNLWWLFGTDFTHLSIIPSQYFSAADPGVILRFNYTENR
jgi:hypothetical protein